MNSDIDDRAGRIKLLLMDCDGVLTDGRLWLTGDGDEQKTFHVRDGQGIGLLHQAGIKTGIISSGATERRAQELNISFVRQDAKDKIEALEEILTRAGVSAHECAYIGDDVGDIPVMNQVGLAVAVADAVEEAKRAAQYLTKANGGHGAVREVCELILKVQGRWEELVEVR
ncbi:MAG: 3-deoxy-D-manno-octulosonate 8-phosphate phosphatase [Acidobacteria bacterium]|nr:MAG: 3-deoxy-D-manno-octulosonate 8-phosphate phosphatase [Acidobacteriota bacterium]